MWNKELVDTYTKCVIYVILSIYDNENTLSSHIVRFDTTSKRTLLVDTRHP
jgi:hypothetical protein